MLECVKGLSSMAPGFLGGFCLTRTVTQLNSNRSMMRPFLMVINTTDQSAATLGACKKRGRHGRRRGMLSAGHPEHPVEVMIVEVGYTSVTRYAEKLQEKMTQHARPYGKLQRAVSRVCFEVSIVPMVFGTTGGVFYSNLDSFRAIGISYERAMHLII